MLTDLMLCLGHNGLGTAAAQALQEGGGLLEGCGFHLGQLKNLLQEGGGSLELP